MIDPAGELREQEDKELDLAAQHTEAAEKAHEAHEAAEAADDASRD